MSEISTKTQNIKLQTLDCRYITDVICLGDDSTVTSDHVTQIPQAALGGKDQNNIVSMSEIKIGDQASDILSKWTEKYNTKLDKSIAWMKLIGASSPGTPRPIVIIGGNPANKDTFDESGTFIPGSPTQENDSGEASKIVISGLGTTSQTLLSNITFEPSIAGWDVAAFALWPPSNRRFYINSSGEIFIFISADTGAPAHARAIILRSPDGGTNWTVSEIDSSWSGAQVMCSLAVDKNENIHFVWSERDAADINRRNLKYRKLLKKGTWSGITTLNATNTAYNLNANIQIKPDGLTAAIVWSGQGYGSDTSASNILYRTIDKNGNLGTLTVYTSDGVYNTKMYTFPFVDFDSNGYKHIIYERINDTTAASNIYYLRETSGGMQSAIHVNTEDSNTVYYKSNILIDKNNNVLIAYTIGGSSTIKPLYIKKIIKGSLGARTLVESGGAGKQGSGCPTIQLDTNNNIIVIYENDTTPYYVARKIVTQNLAVGTKSILYTAAANCEPCYPHIPWGMSPTVSGTQPNIPQQGIFLMIVESPVADYSIGDLKIIFTPDCIMGSTTRPIRINTRTINIRGAINKTKFNSMANLAIS